MKNESVCETCSGTGWVTIKRDNAEFARRCDCRTNDILLTKAEKANIPKKFFPCRLDDYYPDAGFSSQKKAKKNVKTFIDNYPGGVKGILLQGKVGVGKTKLLCSIATELLKKIERIDIFYIDWNDLIREMRSGEGHASRDFEVINQLIYRLSTVDLLLFDELGASRMSPWVLDNVYYLFNKRYNNQKITVCATNYFDQSTGNQETLTQRIGERIRSRLYEMTDIVAVGGKDMRKEYQ